ncbi:hypothetical protein FGE25_01325 [Kosakonia sacchari]|nr:hypothetical protein FGE25_01325 [Kosakonia sacchari]
MFRRFAYCARFCAPSSPAPGSVSPEHPAYGRRWKTDRSSSSRKGKNRISLRRLFCDASEVNDCAKINHCIPLRLQYHAAALLVRA